MPDLKRPIARLSRPAPTWMALACLLALAPISAGAGNFGIGATVNAVDWVGDNGPGGSEFDSDKGGQFSLNLKYSEDAFFAGVNMQGGDYRFDLAAPTQFRSTGEVSATDTEVKLQDFELIAGYYFWPQVALFASLKSATFTWQDNYAQVYGGLGFGLSAFLRLDSGWLGFASLGLTGGGIEESGGRRLGKGSSSALVVGGVYPMGEGHTLNFGLKWRGFILDFDDGNSQKHELNGLFFGYQYQFD